MLKNTETVQPMPEKHSQQIAHHEDLASKFAMQFFGNELLRYLGVREKVREIKPTELIRLEARQMHEDFNFLMEDGTWNHLEFERDSIATEDLRRFREYEAVTSRAHQVPVITYVMCSSDVKEPMTSLTEGINTYRIRLIRLKDRNADAVFEKLRAKAPENVTKDDLVPVVLTPLMDGKLTQLERAKLGIRILNGEYKNVSPEDLKRMQATLYILTDKFLSRKEMEEVKEVCAMNAFLQMYVDDGIQLGIRQGIQKGSLEARAADILDLLGDMGAIASDLTDRILNEKNEETLKKWLKLAARSKSIEQFAEEM